MSCQAGMLFELFAVGCAMRTVRVVRETPPCNDNIHDD